jgi:hypothetical protein
MMIMYKLIINKNETFVLVFVEMTLSVPELKFLGQSTGSEFVEEERQDLGEKEVVIDCSVFIVSLPCLVP